MREAAERFGTQCIVVAIDAKRSGSSSWEVFTHGGRKASGLNAIDWAQSMQRFGAGEILLTSMDEDGRQCGYDLDLTASVSARVSIPLIASGGVGRWNISMTVSSPVKRMRCSRPRFFILGPLRFRKPRPICTIAEYLCV